MTATVSRVPVELLQQASAIYCEGNFTDVREALPQLRGLGTPDQILATSHRLRAFINLVQTGVEVPFWIKRAPDTTTVVNQALFEAAAIAPLREAKPDQLVFDLRDLMETAFKIVEPVGTA